MRSFSSLFCCLVSGSENQSVLNGEYFPEAQVCMRSYRTFSMDLLRVAELGTWCEFKWNAMLFNAEYTNLSLSKMLNLICLC